MESNLDAYLGIFYLFRQVIKLSRSDHTCHLARDPKNRKRLFSHPKETMFITQICITIGFVVATLFAIQVKVPVGEDSTI